MIKKTVLLCIVLTACTSHPKEGVVCIQVVDRNGLAQTISSEDRLVNYEKSNFLSSQPYKKVVRIFNKNSSGQSPSVITTYHPNGLIKEYLEVIDGRAFGSFREWYASGALKIEASVIGGPADLTPSSQIHWLFDKTSKVFDENGKLISEINYQKGVLEGKSSYYYPSGKIKKVVPYAHNEIDGVLTKYREDGSILYNIPYKNGKKEGLARAFFIDGSLLYEELYSSTILEKGHYYLKGEKLSSINDGNGFKSVFKKDILSRIVEYKNGVVDGEVRNLLPNGQIASLYHMKDGKKNGEEIVYYTSNPPTKKLSLCYVDGMIQGTVRSWFPNGQMESQREMCRNKKNGLFYGWKSDGSLLFQEEYEDDLLKKGLYYQNGDIVSSIANGSGTATLFDENGLFLKKIRYKQGLPQEE